MYADVAGTDSEGVLQQLALEVPGRCVANRPEPTVAEAERAGREHSAVATVHRFDALVGSVEDVESVELHWRSDRGVRLHALLDNMFGKFRNLQDS
jgi:hypothetical protein